MFQSCHQRQPQTSLHLHPPKRSIQLLPLIARYHRRQSRRALICRRAVQQARTLLFHRSLRRRHSAGLEQFLLAIEPPGRHTPFLRQVALSDPLLPVPNGPLGIAPGLLQVFLERQTRREYLLGMRGVLAAGRQHVPCRGIGVARVDGY